MNKRWNKLCVAALACVALVVPLTACEGRLPTPAADTSTKVAPDLTEAQEKKIRLKILKTIDEADLRDDDVVVEHIPLWAGPSWTFASARPRSTSAAAVCPNTRPFPRTSPRR